MRFFFDDDVVVATSTRVIAEVVPQGFVACKWYSVVFDGVAVVTHAFGFFKPSDGLHLHV